MFKYPGGIPLVLLILSLGLNSACSISIARPTDPKTPDEQMLLSKAIMRSLEGKVLPLPKEGRIRLDYSGHLVDQSMKGDFSLRFARNSIAAWLSQQGAAIVEDNRKGEATIHARAMIQSLGTRQGIRFLGIPQIQSVFLPITLPEIALWKRERQQGYIRFYLDVFDDSTGRLVQSTEPFIGSVTETKYTVFIFFRWKKSELDQPLELED